MCADSVFLFIINGLLMGSLNPSRVPSLTKSRSLPKKKVKGLLETSIKDFL